MTLLVSWMGMDSKKDGLKPGSIYLASDSRISWKGLRYYDHGRKVFGCRNWPDIFGYCGDVLFPSIVLNQIIDLADQGLLFHEGWSCEEKFQAAINKIIQSFNNYPKEVASITDDTLEIIHASRDKSKNFFCRKMKWTRNSNVWKAEDADFKTHSDKLFVTGSGCKEFVDKFDEHWATDNSRTSRAVFHAFCDTLSSMTNKYCGGSPQLVGLYRKFNAKIFGIIRNKKRYLYGMEVSDLAEFNNIDWRNELFEICDGETMKKKSNAQGQPNPLRH